MADLQPVLDGLDRVFGVGIAAPGLINAGAGRVLIAPHLGWREADLTGPFSSALGLPVGAANDAALGPVAESIFGAAPGVGTAIYLNGSASGIGGGIVTEGAQLRLSRVTPESWAIRWSERAEPDVTAVSPAVWTRRSGSSDCSALQAWPAAGSKRSRRP